MMDPPDIESPCRKICLLDPASRVCTGCGRTLDEIAAWATSDRAAKLEILARSGARLAKLS